MWDEVIDHGIYHFLLNLIHHISTPGQLACRYIFFRPQEIQANGKSRECDFGISMEPVLFQGIFQGSGYIFYLSTKIISALFNHLETINKQQSQISVLERKSGPSVTGSSETPGIPNRRQPDFISELIFMLFCIFAFLWSDFNIEYVANIILFL